MWSFVTGLLGGNKGEKAVDGVISGLDKMFYTDEEKADNKIFITGLKIKAMEMYHKSESNLRSVARRALAVMFSQVFLTVVMVTVLCIIDGSKQSMAKADKLIEILKILDNYMWLIITFYFGGYYVEKFAKTAFGNKNKKTEDDDQVPKP